MDIAGSPEEASYSSLKAARVRKEGGAGGRAGGAAGGAVICAVQPWGKACGLDTRTAHHKHCCRCRRACQAAVSAPQQLAAALTARFVEEAQCADAEPRVIQAIQAEADCVSPKEEGEGSTA